MSRAVQVLKTVWDHTVDLDGECESMYEENKKLKKIIKELKDSNKNDSLTNEDELVLQNISKQMQMLVKNKEKRNSPAK